MVNVDHLADLAVFSRNYPDHLRDGLRRSKRGRLTTFASDLKWAAVGEALRRHGPRHIYFAVVGAGIELRFEAEIVDLVFDPRLRDRATKRLLRNRVDPTLADLWEGSVRTLYAVRHIRRIDGAATMNELTVMSKDEPLSTKFKYAYALVYPYLTSRQALDVLPPTPSRNVEVTVVRILRDTKVVKRLKELHANRCQLCGKTVQLSGSTYSEGHHLQPLGGEHRGPDVAGNILIVCPNHHAQLDFRALPIARAALRLHREHVVDAKYLEYHNALTKR